MAEENEIYTADDRLIVALDVDNFDKMKALVDELGDLISTTVQAVIRSAT